VQVNAARPNDEPVNARSGLVDAEGNRCLVADERGDQYFVCDITCED